MAKKEEKLTDLQKITEKYTDKTGKFSTVLLNKELIRFAHQSSVVRKMVMNRETAKAITAYVVFAKFRNVTGNREMTEEEALKLADQLNEENPKDVFREFYAELRKSLRTAKQ